MENVLFYLIKSGALIAVFFAAYYFLLRNETFFRSNRWFLLLGLFTSVILPLVTFRKVIFVEKAENVVWNNVEAIAVENQIQETFEINWFLVAGVIYLVGILILLFRLVIDFQSLILIIKGKTARQQSDYKLIDVSEKVAPFSYFKYIVYNSDLYSASELENILEHEKIHCEQNHSVDVLISRIFCILFWFNPFVWFYKKAILQNLEFIADSEALKRISDKKAYQITLLKVTTHEICVAVTNHFFQSLIKKRIIMLNKNQSKSLNSWKYAIVVPALAAFLFYFQVKVVAQEREIMLEDGSTISASSHEVTDMTWTKNSTDAEFKEDAAAMKKSGITFKFSGIKRNSRGEITAIKLSCKDKLGNHESKNISGTQPIEPIHFVRNVDLNGKGEIGFSSGNANKTVSVTYNDDEDFTVATPEPPMPPSKTVNNVLVKTMTDDNGKVTITVNGETVTVDPQKILADIDIEKIQAEAMEQVKLAMKQIEVAGPQIERAKRQLSETKPMTDDQREDLEEAKRDLEEAKRDLEESKRDIEQSKRELEQSRREFEVQKAALKKSDGDK